MSNNLRGSEIQEFLTRSGWGEAARTPLNPSPQDRDGDADGCTPARIPALPTRRG